MSDTAEHLRLQDVRFNNTPWRKWGPYLSERQWGTVREDYSHDRHRHAQQQRERREDCEEAAEHRDRQVLDPLGRYPSTPFFANVCRFCAAVGHSGHRSRGGRPRPRPRMKKAEGVAGGGGKETSATKTL